MTTIKIMILIALFSLSLNAQVMINEISSTNSIYYDENNDKPDWIELYNSGNESVNLKDWKISDGSDFDEGWKFPDVIIQPKDFLLVFASDLNYSNSGKYIMEASGNGIFPHSNPDSYRYDYTELSGDFEFSVRIHTLNNVDVFGSVGVIVREDLNNRNRFYGVLGQSNERFFCEYLQRDKIGDYPHRKYSKLEMIYPDLVLKVIRHRDSITASILDYEGYCLESNTVFCDYGEKVYVGLALSSTNQVRMGKAAFSTLKINGELFDFTNLKSIDFDLAQPGKSYLSNELHTNFKLSSKGEVLSFWDNNGILIDKVTFPELNSDVSYGRFPDGSDLFKYYAYPSPLGNNKSPMEAILTKPKFSKDAGIYQSPVSLRITHKNMNSKIYYTTDGSEPNELSRTYLGEEIVVEKNMVIKAIAYEVGYIPSQIETATFLINPIKSDLPIISVTTDDKYLYSEDIGLFKNPHSTEEYPISFEYFNPDGSRGIVNRMGVKTHGHGAALENQTSLRMLAKSKYGSNELDFPFFGTSGQKSYDKLVIRNSGQDWYGAFLRDAFISVVGNSINYVSGTQYRPVLVYINGDFGGMYNLRERFDDKLLESRHKISTSSVSLFEAPYRLMQGSSRTYRELIDNLQNYDNQTIYSQLDKDVDVKNLIDYSAVSFWANNSDWPGHNFKLWRSSDLDNKWRWILIDFDMSLNFNYLSVYMVDSFKAAMDSANSNPYDFHFPLILLHSLKNLDFRNDFINRNCDLLNSTLHHKFLTPILDSLVNNIINAIPYQRERWKESIPEFDQHIEMMRTYFKERPVFYRNQLREYFNLSGISKLELSSSHQNSCTFTVNSLNKLPENWSGYYLNEIPLKIIAKPNNGFKFIGWVTDSDIISENPEFEIVLTDSLNITAIFEEIPDLKSDLVVINEIMYKSAPDQDTDDWIELFNAGENDVDISGWILKDDNDKRDFALPNGTILKKGEYIVLIENENKFNKFHPAVNNYYGQFTYGFGTEDMVRIYNKEKNLIDSVKYSSVSPWYPEADGQGPSLELIDANLDNSLASSWRVSTVKGGTPGRSNTVTGINEIMYNENFRIFPNPTFQTSNIEFGFDFDSNIEISIFDLLGNPVKQLINSFYYAGNYNTYWDACDNLGNKVSSGLYSLIIKTNRGIIRENIIVN